MSWLRIAISSLPWLVCGPSPEAAAVPNVDVTTAEQPPPAAAPARDVHELPPRRGPLDHAGWA